MNKCEDCVHSMGIVDGERIWCAEIGGVMSKAQCCDKFIQGAKDGPITIDPWHSADID